MPYVFFGPRDLREVDPRPAPSMDPDESTVRAMLEARFDGDDLTHVMQALGLLPYERTLNPTASDAWTRNSTIGIRTDGVNCRNGHERAVYSKRDNKGAWYCRACNSERVRVRRERQKAAA